MARATAAKLEEVRQCGERQHEPRAMTAQELKTAGLWKTGFVCTGTVCWQHCERPDKAKFLRAYVVRLRAGDALHALSV